MDCRVVTILLAVATSVEGALSCQVKWLQPRKPSFMAMVLHHTDRELLLLRSRDSYSMKRLTFHVVSTSVVRRNNSTETYPLG